MYFNFEDRSFETPTIESAMSWREQVLLSLFFHLAVALLLLVVPRLSFVQEMAERRAERLREMAAAAELQAQLQPAVRPDDGRTFVFIQPRVELDPPEAPPPEAVLSDRDRVAQSPVRTFDPENRLPVAEGNSPEFIVAPEEADEEGLDAADVAGREDGAEAAEAAEADEGADESDQLDEPRLADATAGQAEEIETEAEAVDDPGSVPAPDDGELPAFADSLLAEAGTGPGDPDAADEPRIDLTPDGLFGRQVENLRQRVRRETFRNYSGDTGRYGPEIQFDSKGVEFGPWLRRFVAQIRRNWFVPYAIWSMHGHVVLTFNVQEDGALTDLTIFKPSPVEAFNNSAYNALRSSNPTQPLPPEYPDDHAFFTVIFYFNEVPPA